MKFSPAHLNGTLTTRNGGYAVTAGADSATIRCGEAVPEQVVTPLMVDTPLSLSQGSGFFEDQPMKPAVFHETRVSACRCGARLTLTRPMMQIGRAITCPACGHVSRVWQLIVRSNRQGAAAS